MWSINNKKCCKFCDDATAGLRIVTNIGYKNSKVVTKPIFLGSRKSESDDCYLKSCHLCHKALPLDKEIYMYRGELGFCSVECRERQIYLDEIKEFELSSSTNNTRKIFSCERRRHPLELETTSLVFS